MSFEGDLEDVAKGGNLFRGSSKRLTWLKTATVAVALFVTAAACGSSTSSSSSSGTSSGSSTTAATNQASAPGITATSILLGSHQPLTGPAAPGYSEIAPAAEAFFKWVNAHGGVHGRSITLNYQDDAYNPALTTQVVQKLVLQDNVFGIVGGLGTPTHQAVEPFLNTNKIPDLFVASGCDCWNNPSKYPYTYGFQPEYTIEGRIIGKILMAADPTAKVGVLYQNDDFGGGGLQGLQQVLPASMIVAKQPYDPTTLSNGLGTQVAALQAAGANVVVSFTIPAATALELLAEAQAGFHPTMYTSSVSADPVTLSGLVSNFSKGAVSGASAISGIYSLAYLPGFATPNDPWIQLFTKVHAQYDASEPMDGNMIFGMALAYATYQALNAAGQNPTRQSIIAALNSKGSSFTGPGLVPFGFSATNHLGYLGAQLTKITGTLAVPQGPIYVSNATGPVTTTSSVETPPPAALAG